MGDSNTRSKIKLTVSSYEWEGKEEFTYEIRGWNVCYSKVGFDSYEKAKQEGELKLKELTHAN